MFIYIVWWKYFSGGVEIFFRGGGNIFPGGWKYFSGGIKKTVLKIA